MKAQLLDQLAFWRSSLSNLLRLYCCCLPNSACSFLFPLMRESSQRNDGGAEIARVDNAGVDKSARKSRDGHRESGQRSKKKQGWTTREWTRRHEETGVDNAGVDNVGVAQNPSTLLESVPESAGSGPTVCSDMRQF